MTYWRDCEICTAKGHIRPNCEVCEGTGKVDASAEIQAQLDAQAARLVVLVDLQEQIKAYREIDYTAPNGLPGWELRKQCEKRIFELALELFPDESEAV